MKSFKQIIEARYVTSADYKISTNGVKVHKRKKIADTDYVEPKDDDEDDDQKKTYKEDVEQILDEATDKQDLRFMQLARFGLVDKDEVPQLRVAMTAFKADKPLTLNQRTLLLSVTEELIALVTGDDTVFNRVKMDVQHGN